MTKPVRGAKAPQANAKPKVKLISAVPAANAGRTGLQLLPAKAVKPKRATAPALPLPPAPPPPPPHRDELPAPRDIARLLHYGERFGPHKIDARMLPLQLPVSSSAIAIFDPGVPKSWRVFDRPVGSGAFRVMLSVARTEDRERVAAIIIHVGRPPIARWTVAHYRGQKPPKSADQLPRCPVTTGWLALVDCGGQPGSSAAEGPPGVLTVPPSSGITPLEIQLGDSRRALALPCGNGAVAAYWAIDAADKPVCLVVDFDVISLKDWKSKAS